MNLKKALFLTMPVAGLMLAACGDDVTNNYQTGVAVLESGGELDECSDEIVGEMVFVTDSSAVFYCADKKWQKLNGKDGEKGENGSNSVDTLIVRDTIVLNSKDTVIKLDTIYSKDTVYTKDSVFFKDTLVLNHVDTLVLKDTIYNYDTLVVTQKIPSVKYDCETYDCVTTAYLNPAIEYGELLDERDNKVYRTVQIGDQVWMAQNLAYEDPKDIALQGQMWCYYDSTAFCETFGRLYSWSATMGIGSAYNTALTTEGMIEEKHRGICPEGYHVPTRTEWDELVAYVDEHNGAEGIGTSLKSRYLWQARDSISQGTDLFGFAALPSDDHVEGQKSTKLGTTAGYDDYVFRNGDWWSASESTATTASNRYMRFTSEAQYVSSRSKAYGAAVRCLKD